jgi:hypothetical protein
MAYIIIGSVIVVGTAVGMLTGRFLFRRKR